MNEHKAGDSTREQSPDAKVACNALLLLNMLAYFNYENVMEDIFTHVAEHEKRGHSYGHRLDPDGVIDRSINLLDNLLPLGPDGA